MSLIVVAEVRLSIRVRTGRAALATTLAPDGEMSVGTVPKQTGQGKCPQAF